VDQKVLREMLELGSHDALPRHVAIIMDGNGRWAQRRGLPRTMGHYSGMERVRSVVRATSDAGIPYLTLYAFSTENWKRPKEEVSFLMDLLRDSLRKELDEMHKNNVRILTMGQVESLPAQVWEVIRDAREKTKDNTGLTLCVGINYGSHAEICEAACKLARQYKEGIIPEVTPEAFENLLETRAMDIPDPDLMIRTSGEMRLSNYLLYQLAYAELYFTDVCWPEFDDKEYLAALKEFARRTRRFGAL